MVIQNLLLTYVFYCIQEKRLNMIKISELPEHLPYRLRKRKKIHKNVRNCHISLFNFESLH